MYDFHYNFILIKYGISNPLFYVVCTEKFLKDLKYFNETYAKLFEIIKYKVIDKIKIKAVGLRFKAHSYLVGLVMMI